MSDKPTFYESVLTIRVLSKSKPSNSISDLCDRLGEGKENVCEIVGGSCTQISANLMAELLERAEVEPGFFGIKPTGELAFDLANSSDETGCTDDLLVVERRPFNKLMRHLDMEHMVVEEPEEEEAADLYVCNNCDHEAPADEMDDVTDVAQRFGPGDIYTDKQCPVCHCLAFPKEKEE